MRHVHVYIQLRDSPWVYYSMQLYYFALDECFMIKQFNSHVPKLGLDEPMKC